MNRLVIFLCFCLLASARHVWAQQQAPPSPHNTPVVPQLRTSIPVDRNVAVETSPAIRNRKQSEAKNFAKGNNSAIATWTVPSISANVEISGKYAETDLQFNCVNSGRQTLNAPLNVPLPANVDVKKELVVKVDNGSSGNLDNTILLGDQALLEWKRLANELANPAPIEFCGTPLCKTAPVRIPPGAAQDIQVRYGQGLNCEGSRVDFLLPRSESVRNNVPWSLKAVVRAEQPISTVYSPSHKIVKNRSSVNSFEVQLDEQESHQPGSFRLSYLIDQGAGLSATLFVQPDETTPAADGTFLFLLGGPAATPAGKAIPRELTLALDRSGSMQGAKIEQVRSAATKVIEQLEDGESFNVITYNDQIDSFAPRPVRKSADTFAKALTFIDNVKPRGGTNLHGALLESVRQKPVPETLPIVLFLTDGLPTVGETEEVKIRNLVKEQNPYNRRVFTVGVGVDVNTPLLESIAADTRAEPTFVLPDDNVQTKLTDVFKSLKTPILADAALEFLNPDGTPAKQNITDVFPQTLPDLFQDDQIVVLGRYRGEEPLLIRLSGNYLGTRQVKDFTFALKDIPGSTFVSRLWATQKIASLVQDIRESGATSDPYEILSNPKQDPALKAKAEEVLQLTTRYGIVTEYTAFLANDANRPMSRREQVDLAYRNFDQRAVKTRVGLSSVNQSINNTLLQKQYSLNGTNYFWDANMKRVGLPTVQQMGEGAYFLRGDTWIDGRLINSTEVAPQKVISFGTKEHQDLVNRLAEEGRHTPLSLNGNVLMEIDKKAILIQAPANIAPKRRTDAAKQVPQ